MQSVGSEHTAIMFGRSACLFLASQFVTGAGSVPVSADPIPRHMPGIANECIGGSLQDHGSVVPM